MSLTDIIENWSIAHPGRGGADLRALLDQVHDHGRGEARDARDRWIGRASLLEASLATYRRQATALVEALVELGHVDVVDRILAEDGE